MTVNGTFTLILIDKIIILVFFYLQNDEGPLTRTCYRQMKHKQGDIVKVRDCVLLKSGTRKTDLPYVAKVAALWEDPETC